MQLQMIQYLFMIWSFSNVQCENSFTKQSFIYNSWNGLANVNFFAKKEWSYVGCMKFCQKLGGRSPPVRTEKELDDMKGMLADLREFPPFPESLFLSVARGGNNDVALKHWPQHLREAKDGLWRDYYTGENLENYNKTWWEDQGKNWGGEEMGHCATAIGESNESLSWWPSRCSSLTDGTSTVCSCLQKKFLFIRGLCSSSNLKSSYNEDNEDFYWPQHLPASFDKVYFVSWGSDFSRIDYNMTSSQWILSSKGSQTSAVSLADKETYLVGNHNWTVSNDDQRCNLEKGKDRMMNYSTELKLTSCEQGLLGQMYPQDGEDGEFTCNNGQCVSMTKRCDQLPDCDDGSDEEGCRLFSLAKGYNKVISPFAKENETIVPVSINVSVKLLKMVEMKERENTIDLQFEITLEWKDPRITYNNLKKDIFYNALMEDEISKIWLPVLVYVNTDQKETTRLGVQWEWSTFVDVSRDGGFTR